MTEKEKKQIAFDILCIIGNKSDIDIENGWWEIELKGEYAMFASRHYNFIKNYFNKIKNDDTIQRRPMVKERMETFCSHNDRAFCKTYMLMMPDEKYKLVYSRDKLYYEF